MRVERVALEDHGDAALRRRHVVARLATIVVVAGPAVLLWWSERLDEYTMLSAPVRVQVSMKPFIPVNPFSTINVQASETAYLACGTADARVAC